MSKWNHIPKKLSTNSTRRTALKLAAATVVGSALGTTAVAGQTDDRIVWENDLDDIVPSSPTIVDETLYIGTNGSEIYAIDTSTGDEEWVFETDGFVNSSPAVVDETVYIGSNDNKVYAIGRNSGEEQWQFDTGENIRSSPTVADGTVFIGNGEAQGADDPSVYAINATTGEQEWIFEADGRVASGLIVDDGLVYVKATDNVDFDGFIYAISTDSGNLEWSKSVGLGRSSPTIADDTVFAAGGQGVFALDKASGEEQWMVEIDEFSIASSPTVANGTVYIGTNENEVVALNADSGTEVWTFPTEELVLSSPTIVEQTVFVGSDGGNIYSIDANSGDQNWQLSIDDEIHSSPTIIDGILYVGTIQRNPDSSPDGSIFAIDTDHDRSSEGSRVNLGTLGHHDEWSQNKQTVETEVDTDTEEETADGVPGFGVPSAIASLGGAGYLLKRRLSDSGSDDT